MVGYAYGMEFFIAWYSGNPYEMFTFINRATGPYAWAYWTMISCNVHQPPGLLVQEGAHEHPDPVRDVDLRQHRHVVRAVRDHRDVAAPRLPAFLVELLPPDRVGRLVPSRELRPVLHDVLPVRPVPSDGGDRRGRRRCCRRRIRMRIRLPSAPAAGGTTSPKRGRTDGHLRRVLGQFATPADLYRACERVRDAGYTRWDAHSPFPVHGLEGAMGMRRSRLPGSSSSSGWAARRPDSLSRPGCTRGVSADDQRQAPLRLAGLRPDHVRAGRPGRSARRGLRNARTLAAPETPSPTVRLCAIRAVLRRRVFHLDRGRRPESSTPSPRGAF